MNKIFSPVITPNPTTGMTIINKKIIDIIKEKHFDLHNFSKPKFIRNQKLWIIYKNMRLILLAFYIPILRIKGYKTIYNVPASDKALFVSFIIFFISNIFMKRIIHHHHVFSYINKHNKWISIMEKLGKNKIENIFLCEIMKNNYNKIYNNKNPYFILDNSYLLIKNTYPKEYQEKIEIGYLSNITIDKGFEIFCNTCNLLLENNINIDIHIAGPIAGNKEQTMLDKLKRDFPNNIKYYGPIYGENKEKFFKTINVFLFPTIYKNEAQPLVIYEALAHNNLVLSMNRGCISNQILISNQISNSDDFINTTINILSNKEDFEQIRKEQFETFKLKLNKKEKVMKSLNLFLFK